MVDYIEYTEADIIERLLPWQKRGLSYTASGYGRKIPTTKMLKVGKRLHRIYAMIYSNSGSCYIISKGKMLFLR